MPYRDPADRRANWHKNRERKTAQLRASYAKHRDKRLAEKREEYARDPEKLKERNKRQYAKNKEKRVEWARAYRLRNREEANAKANERYQANREKITERRRALRQRPEARDKALAAMKRWLANNPEKALLQHAKRLIAEAAGMRIADVPIDIAEAKVAQLKIHRWAKGTCDSGSGAKREDARSAAEAVGPQSGSRREIAQ